MVEVKIALRVWMKLCQQGADIFQRRYISTGTIIVQITYFKLIKQLLPFLQDRITQNWLYVQRKSAWSEASGVGFYSCNVLLTTVTSVFCIFFPPRSPFSSFINAITRMVRFGFMPRDL